jgi:hypothetical protein
MKTYTVNEQSLIVAFATQEEAAASSATPFDTFTTEQELAELAKGWPAERLLAVWNSVDGLAPATEIKDPAKAAKLIFKRLEKAGDAPARAKKPNADKKAKAGAPAAKGAPAKAKTTKKATATKPAPKATKAAKAATPKKAAAKDEKPAGVRGGSKTAQVIEMLQRKNGATLEEIMDKMGWQKHTVRGFMAGAMKKAGYTVESFKPDGGERTYRLPAK